MDFDCGGVLLALLLGGSGDPVGRRGSALGVRGLYGQHPSAAGGVSVALVSITPLIFTGLSVAFCNRTGLFNIGAEGQFIIGQMGAAVAGYMFTGLPALIHVPLALAAGALAGALWAGVPGLLKAKLGAHEVINTIMMNLHSPLFHPLSG